MYLYSPSDEGFKMRSHHVTLRYSVETIRLEKELEEVGCDESERNTEVTLITEGLTKVKPTVLL